MSLHHKFVEFIPEKVEEGILYVSIEYSTAIHKCVCGCGNEVVTPFSPTDWSLTFNGKSVTLHPSIGNWNFECKSHYWIRNNKIELAGSWTDRKINLGREKDLQRKKEYFEVTNIQKKEPVIQESQKFTFWQKISRLFRF
jgi:hypothetical protein